MPSAIFGKLLQVKYKDVFFLLFLLDIRHVIAESYNSGKPEVLIKTMMMSGCW
jgi:hypothetical protein